MSKGSMSKTRLCHSAGVFADKEISQKNHQEIIWYADDKVLRTLTYCNTNWIVQGYLSVLVARGLEYPEATIYHCGMGYIEPASLTHAIFDSETPDHLWQEAYLEFTQPVDCVLLEVCGLMPFKHCQCCKHKLQEI